MKLKDYISLPTRNRRRMFEKATKLWEILEIGLFELYLIERNPKYKVDMSVWYTHEAFFDSAEHRFLIDKVCSVCLAGSVMAGCYPTYSKKIHQDCADVTPSDFSAFDAAQQKFLALNNLRTGNVVWACRDLNITLPNNVVKLNRKIVSYSQKKKWWKEIKQLLKDLKKANI